MSDLVPVVKRIAMTGALTYGNVRLAEPWSWGPHSFRVSEEEVDVWLNDPDPNPARDWAFELARLIVEGPEGTDG